MRRATLTHRRWRELLTLNAALTLTLLLALALGVTLRLHLLPGVPDLTNPNILIPILAHLFRR